MMDWYKFLTVVSNYLSLKPCDAPDKRSWCAWTTFERLGEDAGYWAAPVPLVAELLVEGTADGGTWGQPFRYSQLAHFVIPQSFYWEYISTQGFQSGVHEQDIEGLSELLNGEGIGHRLTDLVLEVKLY